MCTVSRSLNLTQKADAPVPSVIHVLGGGVINGLTIHADQSGNVSSNVSKITSVNWYQRENGEARRVVLGHARFSCARSHRSSGIPPLAFFSVLASGLRHRSPPTQRRALAHHHQRVAFRTVSRRGLLERSLCSISSKPPLHVLREPRFGATARASLTAGQKYRCSTDDIFSGAERPFLQCRPSSDLRTAIVSLFIARLAASCNSKSASISFRQSSSDSIPKRLITFLPFAARQSF